MNAWDNRPPSRRQPFSFSVAKRIFRLGVKSLWLHRLRSLLTMLGIVFGVSSVIAMLAVGEGASYEAQEQIRRQGSHNVIVKSIKPPEEDKGSQGRTYMVEYGITYDDLQRIRNTIPTVEIVVPERIMRARVWNVGNRVDCDIIGTIPWYPEMRNHPVAIGRFFTENEMEQRANVCVLGHEVIDDLFPLKSALGQSIRISQDYYRVVGIMTPGGSGGETTEGSTDPGVQATTNRIYIPLSAARTRFGEILVKESSGSRDVERVELHELSVRVKELNDVIETSLIIEDLLDRFHKKKDYEVVVPLMLLQQYEKTARVFNVVLGAIAAISLVVGGIGIMNIMLASVTERTREIGIRRALGAKQSDIVLQFLAETVILSGTGGLIGVAMGVTIPYFISMFTNMMTIVTLWSPFLAFCISALVGVVFGLYPALRAAEMDPVEALRHE